MSQSKYASDEISQVDLNDNKTTSPPIETNVKFTSFMVCPLKILVFDGSWLDYLRFTRPDITYTLHVINRFKLASKTTHFAVVLRILCYIKGTLFYGLKYVLSPLKL